tara:strand:- start:476 stop:655 length:180 start_codon:yes stop_codon:yes gene_type:complete
MAKTLRDEFAIAALNGLMGWRVTRSRDRERTAKEAYVIADAMMKERLMKERLEIRDGRE